MLSLGLLLLVQAPGVTPLGHGVQGSITPFREWVAWSRATASRLVLTSVPFNDPEEKDVTTADLDRDGDPDVVVVRKLPFSFPGPKTDLLLMNEGGVLVERTATLAPGLLVADDARDVLAFDCNGDGWLDLVVANTFGQDPRLFLNQGEDAMGSWLGLVERTPWFSPPFPIGPQFCAVYDGDVDNDGDADLYFSDYNNTLEDRLLINQGNGFFEDQTAARFPTGINSSLFGTGSFICDFTGDGWNDILKVSGSFEPMKLLINDTTGKFLVSQILPSSTVYMARTADFDLDGRRDIYTVSDAQDYLLSNLSTDASGLIVTGRMNNTSSPLTANFGGNVHEADLDRDGYLDLGVADVDVDIPGCTRHFVPLRNRMPASEGFEDPNGGAFLPWITLGTHDFAWLDLNGDGFQDLFQAHCNGYEVFVMQPFAVAVPPPVPSSASGPTIGAKGVSVLGNTDFALTLKGARPGARPVLLLSTNRTASAGSAAPADLVGVRKLPGPTVADDGTAQLALPIPNAPEVDGLRLFVRWAIPDPDAPGGWAHSGILELFLSSRTLKR